MLSVRIRGQNYRISNETLDRVFGETWRDSNVGLLQKRIQQHHDARKLVVQGQRLQVATTPKKQNSSCAWPKARRTFFGGGCSA